MDNSRREFLAVSGVLTGLLVAGGPLALLAPSRAWSIELRTLSSSEGATLQSMTRTIAPHDRLDNAAYALVVKAIDESLQADQHLADVIQSGLGKLGSNFATSPEEVRVNMLKNIEATEFFQTVRAKTLATLYASPLAYAFFGYEGEAFSKGGYLGRGFNDLKWLPEVPLEDSGPVPN